MRVLLDESLPRGLGKLLTGHDVRTVPGTGWAGLKNGELLERAQEEFDVFMTMDTNLPYQQTLERFRMAVIVLRAPTNRLPDLRPMIPEILRALPDVQPGELRWVGA